MKLTETTLTGQQIIESIQKEGKQMFPDNELHRHAYTLARSEEYFDMFLSIVKDAGSIIEKLNTPPQSPPPNFNRWN